MTIKVFNNDGSKVNIQWWTFPGGERNCKIPDSSILDNIVFIDVYFESQSELIDLMLLCNAIRHRASYTKIHFFIPYFPYARQDRVMTSGESFALQVAADVIKSCNPEEVEVLDPHSDVLAGLFPPGMLKIRYQWDIVYGMMLGQVPSNSYLVSPDAGALKKIYKLANYTKFPVIESSKVRDVETGEIVATKIVNNPVPKDQPVNLIVVDDIIDGGRTFIELAKVLRSEFVVEKLYLFATHGIFSKGKACLEEYYDVICVENDMSKA